MARITAHLRHHPASVMGQYAVPAALGAALTVCMPLLALAAFFLRGAVVAGVAVAIAVAATLAAWKVISPSLGPRVNAAVKDYAGPAAIGITLAVFFPLLGIVALVARGALFALLSAAVVIALGLAAWKLWHSRHGVPPKSDVR